VPNSATKEFPITLGPGGGLNIHQFIVPRAVAVGAR
jgi:hypothetical protein